MAKPQHGSNEPKWFNWLAHLDAEVSKLPVTATSWEYSAFTRARYPQLQPKVDPKVDPFANLIREHFHGYLARYEADIKSHKDAKRALEGLNRDQRMQLAALLIETMDYLKMPNGQAIGKRRRHREAQAGRRKIDRKIASARRALLALRHCAAEKGLHGLMFDALFEDCLANFDGFAHQLERQLESHFSIPPYRLLSSSQAPNMIALGMVKLYWFFRHGCNRTGKESEVRTALIRNAFWPQHGVPPVDLLLKYRGAGESKGCTAVRLAVSRFRLDRGTSH